MAPRTMMKKRQKHPEFPLVEQHMPAILAAPDYVGRHPADGSYSLLLRVKGLPNNQVAALVAMKRRPNQNKEYELKSAYGVDEEAIAKWLAMGTLKPTK